MDKNNRKLKILCKRIKANLNCCTYHRLKYSSPNHSKKANKSHTKEPTFQKMEVYGKRKSGEWAKSRKG